MVLVELPQVVLKLSGSLAAPVTGASVQVNYAADDSEAPVYDEIGNAVANPLTTSHGRVEGWVEEGSYKLEISHPAATIEPYTERFEAVVGRGHLDLLKALAAAPDALMTSGITRDADGAITAASVTWPDGTPGTYSGTAAVQAPGAVDSYTVTYGSPVVHTFTQPTVTRDASGYVTTRPAITVS